MPAKPEETTPLHDKLQSEGTQSTDPDPTKAAPPVEVAPDLNYLNDVASADITSFEEDDDPLSNVGELVDEGPVALPEEKK